MKTVSPNYEKKLSDLAETLVTPSRFGGIAFQQTIEFYPISEAEVIQFPGGLQLKNPPEHGWDVPPAA